MANKGIFVLLSCLIEYLVGWINVIYFLLESLSMSSVYVFRAAMKKDTVDIECERW